MTNKFDDWEEIFLIGSHKFAERQVGYFNIQNTDRFAFKDNNFIFGYYHPLSEKFTLVTETAISPTHKILPKWSLFKQLAFSIDKGLLANFSLRHTEYNKSDVETAGIGAEYYFGNYHSAVTFYISDVQDAGRTNSVRAVINYYYSDRGRVGLAVASGEEVENVGFNRILESDIRDITASLRHWFTDNCAVNFQLSWHDQGESYVKKGIMLGIRYKF